MKKFNVPCDFNGVKSPFTIYVGTSKGDRHPINFQSDWLSKERSGTVPPEVMDSLSKLRELADQNNVSFEDLCVYALGTAQQEQEAEGSAVEEQEAEDSTVEEQEAEGSAVEEQEAEGSAVEEQEAEGSAVEEQSAPTKEQEKPPSA